MIITLSPCHHVIQMFKWSHPHHRHIVKLEVNTAPSPSLYWQYIKTSVMRVIDAYTPSSEFSIKCAWNKPIWFGQTDKRRDAFIWIMEHGSRSITPIIASWSVNGEACVNHYMISSLNTSSPRTSKDTKNKSYMLLKTEIKRKKWII